MSTLQDQDKAFTLLLKQMVVFQLSIATMLIGLAIVGTSRYVLGPIVGLLGSVGALYGRAILLAAALTAIRKRHT